MSVPNSSNPFAARAPAAGYLYQCRYALLLLLDRCKDDPDAAASIEKFDDISFDNQGSPKELIQSKHHLCSQPDLTDHSPDLWRSLRVWSDGLAYKPFPGPGTTMALVAIILLVMVLVLLDLGAAAPGRRQPRVQA